MQLRNRSSKIELLRAIPLFRGLSQKHLNELAKHTDELTFDADHVLMREGAKGDELFIVVAGEARGERNGRHLFTLGPGDFIGELALLDSKPRSATVTCHEPMTVLVVSRAALKPLLRSVPGLAEGMLKSLAGRLREANEPLKD